MRIDSRNFSFAVLCGAVVLVVFLIVKDSAVTGPSGGEMPLGQRTDAALRETQTWTGTDPMSTDFFEITTSESRISWRSEPSEGFTEQYFQATLIKDAQTPSETVVATVFNRAAAADTFQVRTGPGRYRLDVVSSGAKWSMSVSEPRR
jgi:hypothetical protein